MPRRLHRQRFPPSRRHAHVDVNRVCRDAFDRPSLAPELPAHHAHLRQVVVGNLWNLGRFYFLVARCGHLQRRRQVRPQLEPVHATRLVPLWHLLVNDPAARSHPLHVACGNRPAIAHAVSVFYRTGKHVGNRLDAAMRMPGKPRQIVRRHVIAKIVQQQERIELLRIAEAKRPPQMHSRAFDGWLRPYQLLHRP